VPIPDGVTTPAVSDGYFIFLAPLSPGKHRLHFHAEFNGIIEDITYYLTVAGFSFQGDSAATAQH
jgi:hypothetical protein